MRTTSWILVLLSAAAAAHILYIYPLLPETVASHFGITGEPDGWASKQAFLAIYAGVVAVLAGTFGGLALLLPRLPVSAVNVPHREYWLAPERRAASVAAIRTCLAWIGGASLAFTIATMHLAFRVSVGLQPGLGDTFWWLFGALAAAVVGTLLWIWKRFSKPPEAETATAGPGPR